MLPRNLPFSATCAINADGINLAFVSRVKWLLASIAISALVLWALGCVGRHA